MAVWQFDVVFFQGAHWAPLSAVVRRSASVVLATRFGAGDEMLEGWKVFGSETGNRVDLLELEDGTCEIHARFDARSSETDRFSEEVARVAQTLKCSIYCPETDSDIAADGSALREALQRSDAWRFALDPEEFVRNLRQPPSQ